MISQSRVSLPLNASAVMAFGLEADSNVRSLNVFASAHECAGLQGAVQYRRSHVCRTTSRYRNSAQSGRLLSTQDVFGRRI